MPLNNAASDVATFLNGKTVGSVVLTLATNLFIGQMRSGERTPSPAVFCLATGGAAPQPYLGSGRTGFYRPTVQVMVRGPAGDDQVGEAMARDLAALLNQQVVSGYVSWFTRDSAPAFLGTDTDQHGQWVLNVECDYVTSLG
jgi:Bacteriophage minor capsid protein